MIRNAWEGAGPYLVALFVGFLWGALLILALLLYLAVAP